jgi:predicted MFS family arabinose efflux permease
VVTAVGVVEVWMVMVLALALGSVHAFSHPVKQNLVLDMVGPDDVANAATLTSVVRNVAKVVGPALAGLLIAAVGIAGSFFLNAVSYLGVVWALALVQLDHLPAPRRAPRSAGQLRLGLRYVRATPSLRRTLVLLTVWGVLAYEWVITLPLLARDVFAGGAETYGLMFSAMGVGAVIGGLLVAGQVTPTPRSLRGAAFAFAGLTLLLAVTPWLAVALLLLSLLGGATIALRTLGTVLIQLDAAPELRGRVLAFAAMSLTGSTAVGAPLVGWMADVLGIRLTLASGAVATIFAAVWMSRSARHADEAGVPVEPRQV